MNAEQLQIEPPDINRAFVGSAIGHVVIVLFFTVKAVFFPHEPIVISNSIRVDMVALPDKIQPPPAEVEKEAPKVSSHPALEEPKVKVEKPKEPKEPKVDLEKIKKEQQAALEKLKSQLAKKEEPKEPPPVKDPTLYKGNVLSPGSDIKGVAKIEYDRYFEVVRAKVKAKLVLPQWLKDANLRAQVVVKLDYSGYVIFKSLMKSSGNDIYDNLILDALTEASPLPGPPEKLKNLIMIDGMVLGFPD